MWEEKGMQTRFTGRIGVRSALALACMSFGGAASAQAPPTGTSVGNAAPPKSDSGGAPSGTSQFADRKVSIDLDNARLVVAVPQLLKSVGAEYIIDADVKNAIISSHLTNVKLHTALDVLMRVSSLPVQYTFEKGVYHFSKKVEPPPETPSPLPYTPGEAVLPPPPTSLDETIDVHEVQTFDLLRVLNGVFGTQGTIGDPGANGSLSGYSGASQHGVSGKGITAGGIGSVFGTQASGNNGQNSQSGAIGPTITLFGHRIQFGPPRH
jgi:hypothetical protein